MPHSHGLRPSASRLRQLADALESDGDDILAAAARRAADEVDASPPSESSPPPHTLDDEAHRDGDASP